MSTRVPAELWRHVPYETRIALPMGELLIFLSLTKGVELCYSLKDGHRAQRSPVHAIFLAGSHSTVAGSTLSHRAGRRYGDRTSRALSCEALVRPLPSCRSRIAVSPRSPTDPLPRVTSSGIQWPMSGLLVAASLAASSTPCRGSHRHLHPWSGVSSRAHNGREGVSPCC
jgi:hypothetical protein